MRLREHLRRVGKSVAEFAEEIGEPCSVVAGWVYEQKQPTLPNAVLVETATAGAVPARDLVLPGKLKTLPSAARAVQQAGATSGD